MSVHLQTPLLVSLSVIHILDSPGFEMELDQWLEHLDSLGFSRQPVEHSELILSVDHATQ